VNIEDIQMNKEKHVPIWKRPKRTKNHQEKYGETEKASSTIMKYLFEKKEMEAKTENLVHPVDSFLSGIGTTLKTLDPYNLNTIKLTINVFVFCLACELVNSSRSSMVIYYPIIIFILIVRISCKFIFIMSFFLQVPNKCIISYICKIIMNSIFLLIGQWVIIQKLSHCKIKP